jgi:hypothetical protein
MVHGERYPRLQRDDGGVGRRTADQLERHPVPANTHRSDLVQHQLAELLGNDDDESEYVVGVQLDIGHDGQQHVGQRLEQHGSQHDEQHFGQRVGLITCEHGDQPGSAHERAEHDQRRQRDGHADECGLSGAGHQLRAVDRQRVEGWRRDGLVER